MCAKTQGSVRNYEENTLPIACRYGLSRGMRGGIVRVGRHSEASHLAGSGEDLPAPTREIR